MKLLKRKDIKWDIVKANFPSPKIFGWPMSGPFISTAGNKLFRVEKTDGDSITKWFVEFRIPFTHTITWKVIDDNGNYLGKDQMYPVISHRVARFYWNGFLWFWRSY